MSALRTVLKLLPELKQDELRQVKDRLSLLIEQAPVTSDDWLLDGIVSELQRRGLLPKATHWTYRKLLPKSFREKSLAVRTMLLDAVLRPTSTTERQALGKAVARALADYLERTPSFGLRVMLQNVDKIPQAMDASYPGYVAAGSLGVLVHPMVSKLVRKR